jgi:hypothetical protein
MGLQWLPELERRYPNLVVHKYEVKANPENRRRFHETAERHHTTVKGVPTFFLGEIPSSASTETRPAPP